MQEAELKIFVEGAMNYFHLVSGQDAEIGVPFAQSKDSSLFEYTGAIGISGARKGCIYITAPGSLVDTLIETLNPGMPVSEDVRLDMVGELANTIAGNAQQAFGNSFMISLPIVITGQQTDIKLPVRVPVFGIPFAWKGHKGQLSVGIE